MQTALGRRGLLGRAATPAGLDLATFRCAVRGHVNQAQSLTMADILAMPRVELAAVNQCSGNSRGLFAPRIAGGQGENGAMGNARWVGVQLRDVRCCTPTRRRCHRPTWPASSPISPP